jgi:hypothetical protein
MEQNKVYAVQRRNEWWSVVDCGIAREGGMTIGIPSPYFKNNGRNYRWMDKLFMPPENLQEWQEIETIQKTITVVESPGNVFEGWEKGVDGMIESYVKFTELIGHPMTETEIINLLNKTYAT